MIYLFYFFTGSFIGWLVDSLYCSLCSHKWVSSGYFKGVPFCPVYGLAALLVLKSFIFFQNDPAFMVILVTTAVVIAFDYLSNLAIEAVIHRKLWDYSNEHPNFQGRISLWHSFLSLVGVIFMYSIFSK